MIKMINGEVLLRAEYPNLDENQYQPAGIDLTLDKISKLVHNEGTTYGLLKNAKILPKHEELEPKSIMASGMIVEAFTLEPGESYIATTKEKIKITEDSGQLYLPRSSCLRAGIDICTAFGDPSFNGHLSFLIINHTKYPFILEKGVRFAQLIDIEARGVKNKYDGDYNESTD